ncbi:RimK family alpha-L-glutamate ligase [bacterium]|nr:RimK family alpha-L-glutamate ligase [bacterium]
MKIAILSRSPRAYSTKRLREAAKARGHEVRVFDTLKFSIFIEKKKPQLHYRNKSFGRYDAIIPRIGASITFFGTAVVRHFEQMGVYTLSSSQAIGVSRDKLRASQILSSHDIGTPATAFVRDKDAVIPAIEKVGGAPVIIKLLEGTQGVGVILADTVKTAQAIVETLQSTKQNVLIQKFVAESKGRDIRCLVVGGKVVAAMRRTAVGDEFRSNVHRGGLVEAVQLSPQYEATAILAAQILGLSVAGVDLLEGNAGPQVMEVNSSPGFEGIERATKIDVAGAVIEHLEEEASFPEVDIRQRLTLKAGYSIVEIPITDDSELVHKSLFNSNLKERDILVLSINRSGLTIPNPRGTREILPGDTLLCFGKQTTLKELIPKRRQSTRKSKSNPA